ncbi:MAG: type IV toxin-antitoxin system AbiEi family antitoxin domain-containing protein [Solirubrobacteraceae bacterium]
MGDSSNQVGRISQSPVEPTIRERARQQHGHVTRTQLLEIGLGSGAIGARVKSGALVRRYPGVYAIPPARDDPPALAAAAVLACGPHAVLSHASAAYLWGFLPRWEPPPEVTLTQGDRRPRGIVTHRCQSFKRRDVRRQLGVLVTSPARTVLDIAPRLTTRQLTRMVNDARRSGHLHLATLTDLLARNPLHPGTKLLRPFAEHPTNPTRSGFEDDFLVFVARYGLPVPQINVKLNGREVDVLFPDHKLIVELDGWGYHKDRHAFESDRERDAENLRLGHRTIRITEERFTQTPDREAARLHEILRDGE